MSWLQRVADAPSAFEGVLGLRPELLQLYRAFYSTLWKPDLVPAGLIELCRLRIATVHACDAELAIRHANTGVTDEQVAVVTGWYTATCFSPVERAVLAFAEKIPWQHHGVTDDDVDALRSHLTDAQVVALTVAAAMFDANCRLRLVFDVETRPLVADAPVADGILY